jgi:hypothetical protein
MALFVCFDPEAEPAALLSAQIVDGDLEAFRLVKKPDRGTGQAHLSLERFDIHRGEMAREFRASHIGSNCVHGDSLKPRLPV